MKTHRLITIQTQTLDKIFCNACGREITKDTYNEFEEYLEVDKHWGYHSLHDGEHHAFDICADCYEKWIKEFKIKL